MIASVTTKISPNASIAMVGAFSFCLHSFAKRFIYRARFERGFLGRNALPKLRVSLRHSRSVDPQPSLKMTHSVCRQGPFSWVFSFRKSCRLRWTDWCEAERLSVAPATKRIKYPPTRASLKTVCAVHIPHFAGRKAKVNPVSGAILRRASECAALASETAAFLPLGHNLAGQDSKHDLSNAKGLCPSHPVSQNIESKAWGENLEAVCQVRIEYDERFVARPYGVLCTCGFHGAAQTQEEAERVKACHVRLCSRSARGGAG